MVNEGSHCFLVRFWGYFTWHLSFLWGIGSRERAVFLASVLNKRLGSRVMELLKV